MIRRIAWLPADAPPDSPRTVLVAMEDTVVIEPFGERVWLGYYSDGQWSEVGAASITVTHWAELPDHPDCEDRR